MTKTLIIEDDTLLALSLQSILELHHHKVWIVNSYQEAIEQELITYDFFVVDINLPDGDGIELCREIRKVGSQPILILTAYDGEDYAVRAFEAGADDYVIKPFRGRELVARMEAMLRRTRISREVQGYRSGSLFVPVEHSCVYWENQPLDFTAQEYRLLLLLLSHYGERLSREEMFRKVWAGSPMEIEDNTLSVSMSRLRKKLEKIGCSGAIETSWGSGYRWALPVDAVVR